MTLDEVKFWLREHNGMVAFEEIITLLRQDAVRVELEWKFVRKETASLSSSGDDQAEAICAVVDELKAGG